MKKIDLYSIQTCGFCHSTKRLITDMGISSFEIDISFDPKLLNAMIRKVNGMVAAPQIFVNNAHLGSFSELYTMQKSGKLKKILKD